MSRLVLMEVDTSPSLELQDLATGIWLDVVEGHIHSFATGRGRNVVIPAKPGQTAMPFVEEALPLQVAGAVWGVGATAALRRADFRATMASLRAILGQVGKVVRLVAHPPVEGLVSAETATIDVQFLRMVEPEPQGWEQYDHLEIHFICVDDPPAWAIA